MSDDVPEITVLHRFSLSFGFNSFYFIRNSDGMAWFARSDDQAVYFESAKTTVAEIQARIPSILNETSFSTAMAMLDPVTVLQLTALFSEERTP